jgi:hypothetical protein
MVLRGFRIALVWAAVVLLAAAPFSARLLHGSTNDDPCTEEPVSHDPAKHAIGAGTAPDHAPHCAICHWWLSSGRFKGSNLHSPPAVDIDLGLVAKATLITRHIVVISNRPARAPPARLLAS